jgi:hypothetical protein
MTTLHDGIRCEHWINEWGEFGVFLKFADMNVFFGKNGKLAFQLYCAIEGAVDIHEG